jgi:beta-mannosidase
MIWQDFMFGNDWQPGTYAFKQSVAKEVEDQIRRLRDHPSIVLWCGNNETESSWNWGRGGQKGADAALAKRMWQDYLTLFSGVIASAVERLNPETPYWPSSPSADYEDTSAEYQSGDMHDWSVWHGKVAFSEYEKHFPRFMTEYGFQSFPEMRTVEAFTEPEDRTSIFTPVMLAHQKNTAGNAIIHDYMLRYYSEPKDFPSFLYASQVLQAEGIKVGAEHLRRLRPRTMGSIFWQLNDCWPVASWSSIDYFGRWKALQYYARRFYSPLLVSPHVENGGLAVYVVSDKVMPTPAQLRIRVMRFDGAVLSEKTQAVQVAELSSKVYMNIPLEELSAAKGIDPAEVFVAADLSVDEKPVSTNLIYLLTSKEVNLPKAQISTDLKKVGDSYRLHLSSTVLARSVYVSFGDADAKVSDNYFDLLPNEPVEIELTSALPIEELQTDLKVMSLVDAFSPATSPAAAPAQ